MQKLINSQFSQVLSQIQQAKHKAYQQINTTLVELYWNIGEYISEQVTSKAWGKSVVEDLAAFIKNQEPNLQGFTARNLWRMKQFYETYNDKEKLSPLVTQISWTNNLLIIAAAKTDEEREFYLRLSKKENYSKRELERQIASGLFERTLLAENKLSNTLKQLPQQPKHIFRDSYALEFLGLPQQHSELDLQHALLHSLKDFILEIGKDFCFVGQEYKVQVGDTDFSIDLLFYHRDLQCLVAFELKTTAFKPADLGQLEFYLEALDRDVKKSHENPSIGILLCRKKNDEIVKYALNRSLSPTVIAEYETKLIPKELLRNKLNEIYRVLESET